jgi:ABC-type sugar transport system ATPase subunit
VRTFYHNNYDREAYVRWSLGMQDPALARAEATGHAGISTFHGTALPASGQRNSSAVPRLTIRDLALPGIQNIHLDAKAGEIIGLYDMNNRGNHELLQCLTGATRPLDGEMFLDGVPYAPDSPDDISRRGVDFLPHNILSCAVVEGMSYSENLELSTMKRHSLFGTFVKKRVQDFLTDEYGRELEAEDPGHAKGRDLNTNDRMRVALQRILLHHPKLLLIEDLLSDMNIELLRIETEYFSRLTETGCTILISSPNLTVLRQVTDRIIVLGTNT